MLRIFIFLLVTAFSSSSFAIRCNAVLVGRGHTAAQAYDLKPASYDDKFLIVRVDNYSFYVDLFDYKSNDSIRMFIHDSSTDVTAVSDGTLKQTAGAGRELILKQILDWESENQLTLILGCYD